MPLAAEPPLTCPAFASAAAKGARVRVSSSQGAMPLLMDTSEALQLLGVDVSRRDIILGDPPALFMLPTIIIGVICLACFRYAPPPPSTSLALISPR